MSDEPKVDIPCKTCKDFKKCIDKIEALKIKQYGVDPDYISDDEDYSFHTDIMDLLTGECKTLEEYFPYNVASRDGLMVQPDADGYKHRLLSSKNFIEEEEWYLRNLVLYWFFREYNVESTE
jgi:hypothetical protein